MLNVSDVLLKSLVMLNSKKLVVNDNYSHTPPIDVTVVLIVFEGMSPMRREDRR
ncbi:hypothetical protein [Candidatus Coxiella mudrowiae]|uniref:hypothetical protein n=1 Tax=Candidatus Coxiella mudrowiae TaxID=2054173 RepID=UPI001FD39219|nr:hypothetical protein [Candidatus Coxiella mudrowiae]